MSHTAPLVVETGEAVDLFATEAEAVAQVHDWLADRQAGADLPVVRTRGAPMMSASAGLRL